MVGSELVVARHTPDLPAWQALTTDRQEGIIVSRLSDSRSAIFGGRRRAGSSWSPVCHH
jgi:hypothetical protein